MKIGLRPLFSKIWSVTAPKLRPKPRFGNWSQLPLIHHNTLTAIVDNLSTGEFLTSNLLLFKVLYICITL